MRDGTPVEVTILNAGTVPAPGFAVYPGGGLRRQLLPALFALIEHPREGVGLFDTGYATRFFPATARWPFWTYRITTPVRLTPADDAVAQLSARGIAAGDVRWIVLSHTDADHLAGLRDFPAARVHCRAEAWQAVKGLKGRAAMRARLVPDLLPDDLEERLVLHGPPAGPPFEPLGATEDLFGDGAVRLVSLPGHAPGHLGAVVTRPDGVTLLLAGDACWTVRAVDRGSRGRIHRRLACDRAAHDATYATLRRLRAERPEVIIVPAHCPDAAAALVSPTASSR